MPAAPSLADRMLPIVVVVATITTITVNALAALGLVNGVTPATISERHPSLLTPAGYAFSIWSLIYLWLVAFSIYQMLRANIGRYKRTRLLYLATCVLDSAWIWFWHHGQITVCGLLILALAGVLFVILERQKEQAPFVEALLTKVPFGIYAGWVTCAALVNLNIILVGLGTDESTQAMFAIVSVAIAAAASFFAVWKLNNYMFPLAAAWALTAIGVHQSGRTAIVVATAFGTVFCLVAAGSVVTKLKDSSSE